MNISADEMSVAFNTHNDKKHWNAARTTAGCVTFNAKNGLVTLLYDETDGRFSVKFNKYQAAWGDYVSAIGRSLFLILNTLKRGGLPVAAPASLEGIVIETAVGAGKDCFVRWRAPDEAVGHVSVPVVRTGDDCSTCGNLLDPAHPDCPHTGEFFPVAPTPEGYEADSADMPPQGTIHVDKSLPPII